MDAKGVVTSADGVGNVVVRIVDSDGAGCGRCHEPGGCGGGMLNQALAGGKVRSVSVPNTLSVRVGESVVLSLQEGAAFRAALRGYLFPLMLIVGGAAVGTFASRWLGHPDVVAAIGMAAGVIAAVRQLVHQQRRIRTASIYRISLKSRGDAVACDAATSRMGQ